MKLFKISWKLLKVFLLFLCIGVVGCYMYVKFSPKLTIDSANNIMLYDINKEVFFKGSQSKEWVGLNYIN